MGLRYLLGRLAVMVPVFFLVVTLVFFMIRFAPGGPFDSERNVSPEIMKNLNAKYHLDESLGKQYLNYLRDLAHFDLGPSFKHANRTVNEIIAEWTRRHTKEEAMALISGAGVPAGAVFDSMELTNEPSFYERGIQQTMVHGERKMAMPTWPVRFDGVPTEVKSAPLLGEHTAEVLADWLDLDAAAVADLRQDGIV